MVRLTLKQTTQQQEELLLASTVKCIEETSLLDFKMASIAKKTKLSMGTIYKYVQSKEDLLVAISAQTILHQHEMLSNIMSFPLTTPERLICTILASPEKFYLYPFGIQLEMLSSNESVLQRASKRRLNALMKADLLIGNVFQSALIRSINNNELMIDEKHLPNDIEMLWTSLRSIYTGFVYTSYQQQTRHRLSHSVNSVYPLALDHPLVQSAQCLINAQPWEKILDRNGLEKAYAFLNKHRYR